RLAVDTTVTLIDGFQYAEGSFLWIVNNIFFQYYSVIITIVCIATMFIVSYMTPAPSYEKIAGLTYGTLSEEDKQASRDSYTKLDVFLSVLLIVVIAGIYIFFS
ncbi:MAG TPA: Na+/glucose cotransporter, partial [Balneolaceae bacterium]|nr:Na+/glucose cotransporter [Balneolaceae bacterium]